MSTTRQVTHTHTLTHFKDLQSAAEVAKNKEGGICGKALGHDNYNPVQGINKEQEKGEEAGHTLGRQ